MTSEQSFFLRLLSDFMKGCPTEKPETLDYPALYGISSIHNLGGIAYVQCKPFLPADVRGNFHKEFLFDVWHYVAANEAYEEVSGELKRNGIEFVLMKGLYTASFYTVPQLRTMGDVDLVVHKEDMGKVSGIMQELGFVRHVEHPEVWSYHKGYIVFEVHSTMFYDYLTVDYDYRNYFSNVWDNTADGEITPSFHYIYMMAHAARHITVAGYGFRPFIDMIMMSGSDRIDFGYVRSELEKIGLLRFAEVCSALCRKWFGIGLPFTPADIDDDFCEEATARVFADGIFGKDNKEVDNTIGASAKALDGGDTPYFLKALKLSAQKIFPAYDNMRYIEQYSFVDGKPYLLPAAWVYRWYYCAKNKFSKGAESIAEPFAKKDEIEKRQQYVSKWGL